MVFKILTILLVLLSTSLWSEEDELWKSQIENYIYRYCDNPCQNLICPLEIDIDKLNYFKKNAQERKGLKQEGLSVLEYVRGNPEIVSIEKTVEDLAQPYFIKDLSIGNICYMVKIKFNIYLTATLLINANYDDSKFCYDLVSKYSYKLLGYSKAKNKICAVWDYAWGRFRWITTDKNYIPDKDPHVEFKKNIKAKDVPFYDPSINTDTVYDMYPR